MKTKYGNMTSAQLREEQQRLHKKLVLPNIAIVLISVVAAISLLLLPLLQLSVRIDERMGKIAADALAEQEGSEEMAEQYAFLLRDVDTEIDVTLRPAELFGAGLSDGTEGLRALIDGAVGDLSAVADELSAQILPAMLGMTAAAASGAEMGEVDLSAADTAGFAATIEKLNAQDFDGARGEFERALPAFLDQLGVTLTDEQEQNALAAYDEAVEQMTVDGEFSATNLLALLGEGSEGTAEGGAEDLLALLDDPGSLAEQLDEETASAVRTACMGISVGILVCAGLWVLLALLALLHIFLPNKKVGMWYVKLTGLLPFLLFFALPAIALAVLPQTQILPAQVASLLPALSVSSMTFLSALCLLALWIVSIFWCHPVKKRIERCKRVLQRRSA